MLNAHRGRPLGGSVDGSIGTSIDFFLSVVYLTLCCDVYVYVFRPRTGFHMAPKLSSIFPESCLLIVVGIIIGLLLFHTNSAGVSPLTPTTFFFYMLPPIILDAGYFMPNRLFFDHLGTILLFAVIGTIWNTVTIGERSVWLYHDVT